MIMVIVMTMGPTPILRTSPFDSHCFDLRRKVMMPKSMALLLFMIWNAPPMISTKAMMAACIWNPFRKAPKICQVWGACSTW